MGYHFEVNDKLLRDMTRVIVEEIHPSRVVLFGSRAQGDARADSDIDLLVVTAEPFEAGRSRRREAARLWRALAHFHVPVDLVLYSEREIEEWRSSSNHLTTRALREGRVLHG
jgi:predicted nucleotidyltransferase